MPDIDARGAMAISRAEAAPYYARFLARIAPPDSRGCRRWSGELNEDGYGRFTWSPDVKRYAHRVAYALFVADVPEGVTVDHRCRVRSCVNPEHLRLLPAEANRLDGSRSRWAGYGLATTGPDVPI